MKNTFILCAFLALSSFTVAQQSEKYPLGDYTELTDTKPHDSDEIWDKQVLRKPKSTDMVKQPTL